MTNSGRYLIAAFGTILLASSAMSAQAATDADLSASFLDTSTVSASFAAPEKTADLLAQSKVSAPEAKAIARGHVGGGEVVDISRKGDTYRVRVIAKNGRVVDVYIDANTGRVKR